MYYFLQYTWGLILNLIGFAIKLANPQGKSFRYKKAIVSEWRHNGCLGIGSFIFLDKSTAGLAFKDGTANQNWKRVIDHEYGHTLQSAMLGPIFLFVIAIPSLIWANLPALDRYREKNHISYYSFYPEKWADKLGKVVKPNEKQSD